MKKLIPIILILFIIAAFCIIVSKREEVPKKLIFRSSFGKEGTALGEFDMPALLAIKENYLYLTDSGNNRIQILKINSDGGLTSQSSFGKQGVGLGEFSEPICLIANKNYLYVIEEYNSRMQILKINPDGNLTSHSTLDFSKERLDFTGFFVMGIAIKENYLYLTDSGNNRIHLLRINHNGSLAAESAFGKQGTGLGQFNTPLGLSIRGNYLYVIDSGNKRIQVLEIKY